MLTAQQAENLNQIVSDVAKEFAPDKRVEVFNVTATPEAYTFTLKGETTLKSAKEALLQRLEESGILFKDSIIVLPTTEFEKKPHGVVTISVANVRTKPEHSAEMATQALMGSPLKVYKAIKGWFLVQTPDNYIGWMDDDGFELMDDSAFKKWNQGEKIILTVNSTLAYESGDSDSDIVTDLVMGNVLVRTGSAGEFVEALLPDGRKCFVRSAEQKNFKEWADNVNPSDISPGEILSTAKLFMGVPYLWGGTSAKGLDCSGFTKTVFYMNGVVLPRDASQQVHVGNFIDAGPDFENLLPGDLLFFGEKATDTTKERITHVAIYLGEKEFIHASGRVKINSFSKEKSNFAPNRLRSFIRAKRLLPDANLPGIVPVKSIINM